MLSKRTSPTPIISHTFELQLFLGDSALRQAWLNAKGNICGNHLAECLQVFTIERLREAECGVDNTRVQPEEVLGDLAGARVVGVKGSNEGGGRAGGVDLIVDATHREDSALELVQVASDFWWVGSLDEAIL